MISRSTATLITAAMLFLISFTAGFNPAWSAARSQTSMVNLLPGTWEDLETETLYTIEATNGKIRVTAIVDDDGEVFEIKSSVWDGKKLRWSCYVPSTSTTLTFETVRIDGDSLWCKWDNGSGSGTQEFKRSKPKAPAANILSSILPGVWEDLETHSRHTIEEKDGGLTVTSVIDDDGEVYPVKNVNWDGTNLQWTYYVPSTGTRVKLKTMRAENGSLWCSWNNGKSSGTQEYQRVVSQNNSELLSVLPGTWEDTDTKTLYTFELRDGKITVTSILDDDGEVFEVKSSDWDGQKFRWTCYVPSTETTLSFETTSIDGDTLWCKWKNDRSSGTQEFIRHKAQASADNNLFRLLPGTWKDLESSTYYTIEERNGSLAVTSIVDHDSEVFDIKDYEWDGTNFSWTCYVPSTQITLQFKTTSIDGDTLWCTWDNGKSSGTQDFRREAAPATESGDEDISSLLPGVWEDLETHSRHVIEEKNGVLTVTSVINPDGEVYEVKDVSWDGKRLLWSYYVPSTGITVKFETQSVNGDQLMCSWDNSENSGTQEFRRKKADI